MSPEAQTAVEPARPAPDHLMLFVQSLRGAPASVLLALALSGRTMTHKELQLWTRCGKDQVTFALKSLVQLGWAAARTSRGPWALARPLIVPIQDLRAGSNPLKGLNNSNESLNYTNSEIPILSPCSKELLPALYEAGIREPTASELAELPHMSLEYLEAHVRAAREDGLRVGAAIEAMRLGAPVPARLTGADRQAEAAEKIRRFMEGR